MIELSGTLPGDLPAGLLRRVRTIYEVDLGRASMGRCSRAAHGAIVPVEETVGRPGVWRAPVVIIDGRSGSGKSTVATTLARHLAMAGIRDLQVTGPDRWYPGWHGLEQGRQTLIELLTGTPPLGTVRSGKAYRDNRTYGYREWDWEQSRPGRFVRLDRDRPLLIEGSGSLCPATAMVADLAIWVDCDAELRRRRALERDGATYEPWWEVWASQEEEHLRVNQPQLLADVIVRCL